MQEAMGQLNVAVGPNQEMFSWVKLFEKTVNGLSEVRMGMKMRGGNKPEDPSGLTGLNKMGQKIGDIMMGPKGFGEKGGMKDQMKNMAYSMVPMGNAFKTGGMLGVAAAGVMGVFGIIKQAFGASSIWNGVVGQFFKIAGYMMDMILMPLLPYFMKFLQWMMTSVMPVVMRVSEAVGELVKGNMAPLIGAIFSGLVKMAWWSLTSFWPTVFKMLFKGLAATVGGIFGGGGGGDGIGPMPDMGSGARVSAGGHRSRAGKAQQNLKRFADTDAAKNNSFYDKWENDMYKTSILPDIRNEVFGFFTNISSSVGGIFDGISNWIGGLGDWLGGVWDTMKEKFWSVVHAVGGFFTGKDTEGNPVANSIPGAVGAVVDSITGGITSFTLAFGDVWDSILTKVLGMWGEWEVGGGGIRGWIYDNIVEKVPSWDSILNVISGAASGTINLGEDMYNRLKEIWGSWPTDDVPTGVGILGWIHVNLWQKIPTWSELEFWLSKIGTSFLGLGYWAADRLRNVWGVWPDDEAGIGGTGLMGWIAEHIWGNIPKWDDVKSGLASLVTTGIGLGEKLGDWFGDTWGSWSDRKGIVGWIRKNTVDFLPSKDDLIMSIGAMLEKMNLATAIVATETDKGGMGYGGDFSYILGYNIKSVGEIFGDLKDWVVENIGSLWEKLEGLIPDIDISWPSMAWIKNIGSTIKEKVADAIWNFLENDGGWYGDAMTWIGDNIPGISHLKSWAKLNKSATSWYFPGDGGAAFGQLGVPKVPGSPGEAVPYILHAGEAVIPAHLANAGTYMNGMVSGTSPAGTQYVDQKNFNITINSTWSPTDLVNDLSRITGMNTTSYVNTVGA